MDEQMHKLSQVGLMPLLGHFYQLNISEVKHDEICNFFFIQFECMGHTLNSYNIKILFEVVQLSST